MTLRRTPLMPLLLVAAAVFTACESRPPARPTPIEPSLRGGVVPDDPTAAQNPVGTDAASTSPPPRLLRVRRQASS